MAEKNPNQVGAFDAKTHLSELLERIEKTGAVITITRRGVPIAELGPVRKRAAKSHTADLVKAFRDFQRAHPLKGLTTHDLVREGRRR